MASRERGIELLGGYLQGYGFRIGFTARKVESRNQIIKVAHNGHCRPGLENDLGYNTKEKSTVIFTFRT